MWRTLPLNEHPVTVLSVLCAVVAEDPLHSIRVSTHDYASAIAHHRESHTPEESSDAPTSGENVRAGQEHAAGGFVRHAPGESAAFRKGNSGGAARPDAGQPFLGRVRRATGKLRELDVRARRLPRAQRGRRRAVVQNRK